MNFILPVLHSDSSLTTMLAPEFARVRKHKGALGHAVAWSIRLFVLEGVGLWIVLALSREALVRFVYGEQYVAYADLLLLVGALPVLASCINVYTIALRALEQTRGDFWSTAVSGVMAIAVGFAAIPLAGIKGALIAMVLSSAVRAAVMACFLYRRPGLASSPAAVTATGVS